MNRKRTRVVTCSAASRTACSCSAFMFSRTCAVREWVLETSALVTRLGHTGIATAEFLLASDRLKKRRAKKHINSCSQDYTDKRNSHSPLCVP
jgi:hypothetical protein